MDARRERGISSAEENAAVRNLNTRGREGVREGGSEGGSEGVREGVREEGS